MLCHPIYDFVLSITTSNVIWWNKNVKPTFQKEILEKRLAAIYFFTAEKNTEVLRFYLKIISNGV